MPLIAVGNIIALIAIGVYLIAYHKTVLAPGRNKKEQAFWVVIKCTAIGVIVAVFAFRIFSARD